MTIIQRMRVQAWRVYGFLQPLAVVAEVIRQLFTKSEQEICYHDSEDGEAANRVVIVESLKPFMVFYQDGSIDRSDHSAYRFFARTTYIAYACIQPGETVEVV